MQGLAERGNKERIFGAASYPFLITGWLAERFHNIFTWTNGVRMGA